MSTSFDNKTVKFYCFKILYIDYKTTSTSMSVPFVFRSKLYYTTSIHASYVCILQHFTNQLITIMSIIADWQLKYMSMHWLRALAQTCQQHPLSDDTHALNVYIYDIQVRTGHTTQYWDILQYSRWTPKEIETAENLKSTTSARPKSPNTLERHVPRNNSFYRFLVALNQKTSLLS